MGEMADDVTDMADKQVMDRLLVIKELLEKNDTELAHLCSVSRKPIIISICKQALDKKRLSEKQRWVLIYHIADEVDYDD